MRSVQMEQISTEYRQRARECHPDKSDGSGLFVEDVICFSSSILISCNSFMDDAEGQFRLLRSAYDVLSDPSSRSDCPYADDVITM